MNSIARACCRTSILRQIAFKNHQLVRNLFILGLSSVAARQVSAFNHVSNLRPSISEVIPAAMSTSAKTYNIPVVEYAEVKDLPNHPEKLLIDVREPQELQESGIIPTAINIPLATIEQELALNVPPEQFLKKYGRTKPDLDSYIIVQCRSGKRSQKGAELAAALGYTNVHNYVGSWLDWAEREGLPKGP